MPRPTKTIRRQKTSAGIAWKKGNREEACKLWADADKARKEFQAKKKKSHKPDVTAQEEAPEGEASEGQASESEG